MIQGMIQGMKVPSRPRMVEEGVAVNLSLDGEIVEVVVGREALYAKVGVPPDHLKRNQIDTMLLGAIQHNIDVVQEAAERKSRKVGGLTGRLILTAEDFS